MTPTIDKLRLFRKLSEMYGEEVELSRMWGELDPKRAMHHNCKALTLEMMAAGLAGILKPGDLASVVVKNLFDRSRVTASIRDIAKALGTDNHIMLHGWLRENGISIQPSHINQILTRNTKTYETTHH